MLALVWYAWSLPIAYATIFYQETFSDGDGWKKRWATAVDSQTTQGEWGLSAGEFVGDQAKGTGLQTKTDAAHYHLSTRLPAPVALDRSKDIVIQYSVKHEQRIECGGGYIKLFGAQLDQKTLSRDTPYIVLFGPDICGTETRHVKLELNFADGHTRKFIPTKRAIRCRTDYVTHFYTLRLTPDDRYEVYVDFTLRKDGDLQHGWDVSNAKGSTKLPPVHYLGFDLWQVKAGSIFDNLLIGDDYEEAKQAALEQFPDEMRAKENALFKEFDDERQRQQEELQQQILEERKRQDEEIARYQAQAAASHAEL